MVEDVEKLLHRIVFPPVLRQQKLRVDRRHHGDCRAKPHEFDRHVRLAVLRCLQLVNLAGRKRERGTRCKADRLTLRRDEISHRLAFALHLLEHAHSLEEMHPERLLLQ